MSGAELPVPSVAAKPPCFVIDPPGRWPRFDLREFWGTRELLYFLVWRDVKVRYKQTVIGIGWAVLQPLLTMVVFTVFFGRLARLPSEGIPHPVFFYAGLLPWTYFSSSLSAATSSTVEHQRVITKVYFPRIFLPLSSVLGNLLDLGIASLLLFALLPAYGIVPGVRAVLLPLFVALAMATAFGAGLWLSALNALYRDVRYAVPFFVQLLLFASPVAYPSTLVPERWRWLYGLNPLAGVVEGFRWALTGRGPAPGLPLVLSVAAVLLLLLGGLLYFHRVEATIADVV
jgi:lipopolysaccharide transport system permease protein